MPNALILNQPSDLSPAKGAWEGSPEPNPECHLFLIYWWEFGSAPAQFRGQWKKKESVRMEEKKQGWRRCEEEGSEGGQELERLRESETWWYDTIRYTISSTRGTGMYYLWFWLKLHMCSNDTCHLLLKSHFHNTHLLPPLRSFLGYFCHYFCTESSQLIWMMNYSFNLKAESGRRREREKGREMSLLQSRWERERGQRQGYSIREQWWPLNKLSTSPISVSLHCTAPEMVTAVFPCPGSPYPHGLFSIS